MNKEGKKQFVDKFHDSTITAKCQLRFPFIEGAYLLEERFAFGQDL